MNRDRYDVLERYTQIVDAPEPDLDRFLRRRDRRRRTQRITAGVVALVVFAAAMWVVVGGHPATDTPTPAVTGPSGGKPDQRTGFVGLPPEGSEPSTPRTGNLVMSVDATLGEPSYRAWFFADGRMIWFRRGNLSYGANSIVTGYLEQRLTAAGVEELRSQVLATGLFEHDLALVTRGTSLSGTVRVREGDRLVTLSWTEAYNPALSPPRDAATATREQDAALDRLEQLLTYPAPSQIPDDAWADRTVRPYVASRYAFCYTALTDPVEPSDFRSTLTLPAQSLLRGTTPSRSVAQANDRYCWAVSTDHARLLDELLPHINAKPDPAAAAWGAYYRVAIPSAGGVKVEISFEPYLPDGELVCTACTPYGSPLPG